MALTFGRVSLDDLTVELRPEVLAVNTAWNDLGPRRRLGICRHSMLGSLMGTTRYFAGEARNTALTDCGIGGPWDGPLDGVMHQYIPRGVSASPWASGPASDLEGDGIAFVRVLGVAAVNRDLFSVERSDGGREAAPFSARETPLQWETMARVIAYVFDQAEVPWDVFPKNPAVGITTFIDHWEFGPKQCPFAAVRAETDRQIDYVRALMKAAQTGVGSQTPGKVEPVPADPDAVRVVVPYSEDSDVAFLRRRFGSAVKVRADGTVEQGADGRPVEYRFDPKGVVSNAWIQRFAATGEAPALINVAEDVQPDGAGGTRLVTYFEFANGATLLNVSDDRRGWYWAGDEAA